jgi:lysyl-tRNA synthetase class 2
MNDIPSDISHDQHAVRRQKLAELRAGGQDPFRANVAITHFSQDAKALYVDGQDYAVNVTVAGRLVTFRVQGGSSFVKIQDQQGQIQVYFRKDVLGEERYAQFKRLLDLGDIIGVTGSLFKTKTGEVTVRVESFTLVSKALRPLPEKFHGLSDPEQVYRQRYLDLIGNSESRARLLLRSKVVSHIRRFLEERQFIEVETPVLENTAGGAAARPFVTHHNALGVDFYLRIATELRLKRLLVGGIDRVFEIGRIFRNEGVSRRHNPEFTMLEVYQAYSDYRGMMTLIRDLLTSLVRDVVKPADGSLKIKHAASGQEIDFGGEWREVRYKDLIKQATGDEAWFERSKAEKVAGAEKLGLYVDPKWEEFEITNEIFSKKIEPTLIEGTVSAGEVERRGSERARRLRADDRRHGGGAGLLGAERPRRAAPDVRGASGRGEAEHRPGFSAGARARHAAGGRDGRRHRPAVHFAHGGGEHSRCDSVSAVATGEWECGGMILNHRDTEGTEPN